jgi:hypothetical protein
VSAAVGVVPNLVGRQAKSVRDVYLWHDFHLQAGVLADADAAIEDLGARLRTHMEGKVATK